MNRCLRRVACVVIGLSLVALHAESAWAQGGGRGGGRRGGFGRGFRNNHQVELATLPEVQADLKLTDEQKTKVADLNDEYRDERRAQRGGGGGGFGGGFSPEAREAQAKLDADFASRLNEILDDAQDARILGIFAQVNGTATLNNAAIADALELSDDERAKLAEVADEQRQAMFDSFQDFQDMTDDERREKLDELAKARDAALLAALTDAQRAKFDELKGEALEVDLEPLQRGRGGRGGGFGGGGGGRRGGDDAGGDDAGGAGSGRPAVEE